MNSVDVNKVPTIAGIYCIKNKINGKCYIGQSVQLRKRLLQHLYAGRHHSFSHIYLYKAVLKYGWSAFELTILETVKGIKSLNKLKERLDTLEKKYIK